MRSAIKLGAVLAMAAALDLSLAGCQSLREQAGLTKSSPDEFAVTTKAPLVIPPGFNLRPPTPGAAPLNTPDSSTAATNALFAGDTATVAANIPGNFSTGERMLLASAGLNRADPAIRQRLQSDNGAMQAADAGFTARLLGTAAQPASGPINADAEFERRRGVTPPPAPRKSSGGWFDWF